MWAALLALAAARQGRACPEYFALWPVAIPPAPWGAVVTSFFAHVCPACLVMSSNAVHTALCCI